MNSLFYRHILLIDESNTKHPITLMKICTTDYIIVGIIEGNNQLQGRVEYSYYRLGSSFSWEKSGKRTRAMKFALIIALFFVLFKLTRGCPRPPPRRGKPPPALPLLLKSLRKGLLARTLACLRIRDVISNSQAKVS